MSTLSPLTRIVLLMALLLAGAARAQDAPDLIPLPPDSAVIATLEAGAVTIFRYTAESKQMVTISAHSADEAVPLDLTLAVTDGGGRLIAFNDDRKIVYGALAETDPVIANLVLPTAGEYRIEVRAFAGRGTGKIQVALAVEAPPLSEAEQALVFAETDQTRIAVPVNGVYDYAFEAFRYQNLTITARALSGGFDPILELLDPALVFVAENDDHDQPDSDLGARDSLIADYAVVQTGQYIARVRGFAGSGGEVELTIVRTATPQEPAPPPLRPPIVLEGAVEIGTVFEHVFPAETGDLVSITVRPHTIELDPRLALLDSRARVVATGERVEPNSTQPARIERLRIDQGGVFIAQVRGYLDSSGSFELTIIHEARAVPLGDPIRQILQGEVLPGASATHAFEARTGDYVTITAEALNTGFDPTLRLGEADGQPLAENDDHGSALPALGLLDARIVHYPIPLDGIYLIDVSGRAGSAGLYRLTIETLRADRP